MKEIINYAIQANIDDRIQQLPNVNIKQSYKYLAKIYKIVLLEI